MREFAAGRDVVVLRPRHSLGRFKTCARTGSNTYRLRSTAMTATTSRTITPTIRKTRSAPVTLERPGAFVVNHRPLFWMYRGRRDANMLGSDQRIVSGYRARHPDLGGFDRIRVDARFLFTG